MYDLSEIRPGENLRLFACSSPEVIRSVLTSMIDGEESNINILVEPVEGMLDSNRAIFYPYENGEISDGYKYSSSALVYADTEEEIYRFFRESLFSACNRTLGNSLRMITTLLSGRYKLVKFHADLNEEGVHKISTKYAKA